MSGGHWEYVGYRIQEDLFSISTDEIVEQRWPIIARMVNVLGEWVYDVEHDMDFDLCSDAEIPDDTAFDQQKAGKLVTELMKFLPDEWFPNGKWATIQAFQGRSGL